MLVLKNTSTSCLQEVRVFFGIYKPNNDDTPLDQPASPSEPGDL